MAETLGASFSIDITELASGLAQANRLIRESESEFKAAASGMDDWTDSQDGLTAKIKSLNDITAIQREKVNALKKQYDKLISEGLSPTSKEAVDLRTKINNETAALNKNESELNKNKTALKGLTDNSDKAGDEAKNLGEQEKKAAKQTKELGDKAKETEKKLGGMGDVAKTVATGIAAIGTACVGGVSAFLSLADSTKETQTAFAKLDESFTTAGFGAEQTQDTVESLYGVLGDLDKTTEASQLLVKMSKSEKDLRLNTKILTGVYAEFGDSIPTEGLAEAMQATAQLSKVDGVLADALEWQGINLDDYNAKLEAMSSAEERSAFIQRTLLGLYGESADAYRENNQALIESNEAQLKMEQSLAEIGKVALPIMTQIKQFTSELLSSVVPFVKLFGEGLKNAFDGVSGASEKLSQSLSGMLSAVTENVTSLLPTVLTVFSAMFPAIIDSITSALPIVIDAILLVVPQLLEALLNALPSLIDCLSGILARILESLGELLPDIIEKIVEVIPLIIDSLINAFPLLLQASIQFLTAIVQALPTIIKILVEKLPEMIKTITETIIAAYPILMDSAITFMFAIIDAIPEIVDALIDNLPEIIDAIITAIVEAAPVLAAASIKLFFAIIEAIPKIVTSLNAKLPSIVAAIIEVFTTSVPKLYTVCWKMLGQVIEAIKGCVKEVPKHIENLVDTMIAGVKKGIDKMKDIGKRLIEGLWQGISDMTSWITGKLDSFGDTVLDGIKSFFGIHSPSKVMADQVGKNLALGIGEGFENSIGAVTDDITAAMNLDEAKPTSAMARGVNVYQTNNYSQAHSRYELYKSKQQTAAAVRLALGEA